MIDQNSRSDSPLPPSICLSVCLPPIPSIYEKMSSSRSSAVFSWLSSLSSFCVASLSSPPPSTPPPPSSLPDPDAAAAAAGPAAAAAAAAAAGAPRRGRSGTVTPTGAEPESRWDRPALSCTGGGAAMSSSMGCEGTGGRWSSMSMSISIPPKLKKSSSSWSSRRPGARMSSMSSRLSSMLEEGGRRMALALALARPLPFALPLALALPFAFPLALALVLARPLRVSSSVSSASSPSMPASRFTRAPLSSSDSCLTLSSTSSSRSCLSPRSFSFLSLRMAANLTIM
mmetsp:Transcript_18434/g.52664  ORF Transcript_18434/g.52664 Transcript_18434/m.52664 type:complete len:286 (-) Transcript_18434:660-1517(-)